MIQSTHPNPTNVNRAVCGCRGLLLGKNQQIQGYRSLKMTTFLFFDVMNCRQGACLNPGRRGHGISSSLLLTRRLPRYSLPLLKDMQEIILDSHNAVIYFLSELKQTPANCYSESIPTHDSSLREEVHAVPKYQH